MEIFVSMDTRSDEVFVSRRKKHPSLLHSGGKMGDRFTKQDYPHHWKSSKEHSGPRIAHDFQQTEVNQSHENKHVCSVGQGEVRYIENIRGLNFVVIKLTTVQMTMLPF